MLTYPQVFRPAGDANPAQLAYWTAAWLGRIKDLYAAHAQLMAAWEDAAAPAPRESAAAAARLEEAGTAWTRRSPSSTRPAASR